MYYYNHEGLQMLNSFVYKSNYSSIVFIVDENTETFCLPVIAKQIVFKYHTIVLKPGDRHKNIETLQEIWTQLMKMNADRNTLIINLGGGVVTDIGGFAASTFKRGVDFIHFPTSLLGMIDASIGGKNGINFGNAKNQIGNINPPKIVIINTDFLKSLPQTEFDSGLAEMLKHGLITNVDHWKKVIDYNNDKKGNILALIKESIDIKNSIVAQDPNEKNLRKLLNFGHTLGHSIESFLNYNKKQPISHGYAVAIGMVLAAYISTKKTDLPYNEAIEIKEEIKKTFSTIYFAKDDISKIIDFLKFDKKNISGVPQFVLLKRIGTAICNQQVGTHLIEESFDFYMN